MSDEPRVVEFAFPGPLRDSLIAAIASGAKSATSALLRGYELEGEALPAVGARGVVIDSAGEPVFEIETTGVRVVPLGEVPLEHALAEGEGYASVAEWRDGHLAFWHSAEVRAELGEDFVIDDATPVVLESFKVCPESGRAEPTTADGRDAGRSALDAAAEPEWKRRRRLAEIFGEELPDTTSDEREPWRPAEQSASDAWLRAQVPPHHGQSGQD